MTSILAFEIATVPDVAGLRRLLGFDPTVSDPNVIERALQRRRAETGGSDRLPPHLQRIAVVSCLLRNDKQIQLFSFGVDETEGQLLERFFALIESHKPELVSWDGHNSALPLLLNRALAHGIPLPSALSLGAAPSLPHEHSAKRNASPHCDLLQLLRQGSMQESTPLDEMALLCGFPGAISLAADAEQAANDTQTIVLAEQCATAVAKIHLLYLRFQLIHGKLRRTEYHNETSRLRDWMQQQHSPLWQTFLQHWALDPSHQDG